MPQAASSSHTASASAVQGCRARVQTRQADGDVLPAAQNELIGQACRAAGVGQKKPAGQSVAAVELLAQYDPAVQLRHWLALLAPTVGR